MTENAMVPVLECRQVPVIVENLMDMAADFQAKQEYIATLSKDDEGMAKVKALRAETRKTFEALEEQRKAVKAQVEAPYKKAETLYKHFVKTPFEAFDESCKSFVEAVEGSMKAECEARLKEYFCELCGMRGLLWLKWERLGLRVDMATARQKEPRKAMDTILAFVNRVCEDLSAIDQMDDSAELAAEYESCLDITTAIQRVKNRRKAATLAEENRRAREARQVEAATLTEAVKTADVGAVVPLQQEKQFQVTFTVTASMPMLRGLRAFLEDKNYEYQEE